MVNAVGGSQDEKMYKVGKVKLAQAAYIQTTQEAPVPSFFDSLLECGVSAVDGAINAVTTQGLSVDKQISCLRDIVGPKLQDEFDLQLTMLKDAHTRSLRGLANVRVGQGLITAGMIDSERKIQISKDQQSGLLGSLSGFQLSEKTANRIRQNTVQPAETTPKLTTAIVAQVVIVPKTASSPAEAAQHAALDKADFDRRAWLAPRLQNLAERPTKIVAQVTIVPEAASPPVKKVDLSLQILAIRPEAPTAEEELVLECYYVAGQLERPGRGTALQPLDHRNTIAENFAIEDLKKRRNDPSIVKTTPLPSPSLLEAWEERLSTFWNRRMVGSPTRLYVKFRGLLSSVEILIKDMAHGVVDRAKTAWSLLGLGGGEQEKV